MKRAALVFLVVLALAASAAAQTKISGTTQCPKVEKEYKIEVGDRPGHIFAIVQGKCPWSKVEIAGIELKDELWTGFEEVSGNTGRGRFAAVHIMANGDKIFGRGEFTTTWKDGAPQTAEGKWTFTGGTGKFKGLKAKGTHKAKYAADGSFTLEFEGEYELPR